MSHSTEYNKHHTHSPTVMPITAGKGILPEGSGTLAYLLDNIQNMEDGSWIRNCPQSMSWSPRMQEDNRQ